MAINDISLEVLRDNVNYDPITGMLTWRRINGGWRKPGIEIGNIEPKGYRRFQIGVAKIMSHRAAFALHYGHWPAGQVDHINHQKNDNRIENLREVTNSENAQNKIRAKRGTKTGVLGVSVCKDSGLFSAQIMLHKKNKWLGSYKTADEAHAAYKAAKRVLHRTCTL